MCERELDDPQLQRLANAIFVEICKQFDAESPAAPMICGPGGMRDVLVEGHIDLLKVAAALNKRCCVLMPDVETITDAGLSGRNQPEREGRARRARSESQASPV